MTKHPDADCDNCAWNVKEAGFVPSHENGGKYAIVGESPGRGEVDLGKPFQGKLGHLVNATLNNGKFVPDEVFKTNAVLCHSPVPPEEGSQEPPKEVIDACRPRLLKELEGRSGVLLMGNTAVQAATPEVSTGIMKLRKLPPQRVDNMWIVNTVNPGACLRNPDNFPSFVKDVKKLGAVAGNFPNVYSTWEPPKYLAIHDDFHRAQKALSYIMHRTGDLLALDIETGVEKDTSFTHPKEWLSIGFAYGNNKALVIGSEVLKDKRIYKLIGELIDAKKVICHNGKYDLQVLLRLGVPFTPKLYADTMLASYVLDERPGHHGLKGLSSEVLGAPDYEDDIKEFVKGGKSYANIPRDLLYKYNAYDVALTYNLWETLSGQMGEKIRRLHDRLCDISVEYIYVEMAGIWVDKDYQDELASGLLDKISKEEKSLSTWVDNPRSVPQVKLALDALELDADSTGAKILKKLLLVPETMNDEDYEEFLIDKSINGTEAEQFLALLLQSRKTGKLYGTYVKGIQDRMIGGKVYPTFLIHGSVTGRLSCRNPNMQNIPRGSGIKKMFVPAQGNVLIQADYAQAELRTIAVLAKDPYLKEVFSDPNRDIHGEVAQMLFGNGWTKEQRVRAKAYVFGSIYGLSPNTIASDFGITEMQARREQAGFFRMIPMTMKWRQQTVNRIFKDRTHLETPYGRLRRFGLISEATRYKIEKEAWAFLPQSTANDFCLSSLAELRKAFGWSEHSPKIINTVHDSIVVEAPENERKEVAQLMQKIMSETAANTFSEEVPFNVDAEFGKSYGELEEV